GRGTGARFLPCYCVLGAASRHWSHRYQPRSSVFHSRVGEGGAVSRARAARPCALVHLLALLLAVATPAAVVEGAGVVGFPPPTAASGPKEITLGWDGNLWFPERAASKIGRIPPAGVITEFPLVPGSMPTGITSGPDGRLWFTEFGVDRIGRLNPHAGSDS